MKFTKMQGIGNDYIYVDCFREKVDHPSQVARFVSDRRFGIGGDGLILICPSGKADCRMEMYNADGSQGAMCGNGIRCVGKYVYDHGLIPEERETLTVETASGIRTLSIYKHQENGRMKAEALTVDMGKALLTSKLPEPIQVAGRQLEFVGVNVGNPHAVYFVDQADQVDLENWGLSLSIIPDFSRTGSIRSLFRCWTAPISGCGCGREEAGRPGPAAPGQPPAFTPASLPDGRRIR